MKYTLFCVPVMTTVQKYENGTKIGIFPIPSACWSGFGIFELNRGNPDEIGMVGQSEFRSNFAK